MSKPLTTLNPKWINSMDGRSGVGIRFRCPCCDGRCVLAVLFINPLDGGPAVPAGTSIMGENQGRRWSRTGETFETLTTTPSIDASSPSYDEDGKEVPDSKHWHGFIADGEAR